MAVLLSGGWNSPLENIVTHMGTCFAWRLLRFCSLRVFDKFLPLHIICRPLSVPDIASLSGRGISVQLIIAKQQQIICKFRNCFSRANEEDFHLGAHSTYFLRLLLCSLSVFHLIFIFIRWIFAFSTHSSGSVHANFAPMFCYLVKCNIFPMMMMGMGTFPYISLFYGIFWLISMHEDHLIEIDWIFCLRICSALKGGKIYIFALILYCSYAIYEWTLLMLYKLRKKSSLFCVLWDINTLGFHI